MVTLRVAGELCSVDVSDRVDTGEEAGFLATVNLISGEDGALLRALGRGFMWGLDLDFFPPEAKP